jgi:DNA-binding NtrC family response regulator
MIDHSQTKSMLVVDDESSICLAFERFFGDRGWRVVSASTAEQGMVLHANHQPPVVFLDVRLPDTSGLKILEQLARGGSRVVVITAFGALSTVVDAIRGKAYDCLIKPLDLDEALALANRIWETDRLAPAAVQAGAADEHPELIGDSPAMQRVYKLIARAAASHSPVLIEGETGTGKELAARAIHRFSTRSQAAFVPVNCGAIPEQLIESDLFGHVRGAFTGAERDRAGRFEAAHGGCLMLDEVGDLPLAVQVKLLRVLDDGWIERVGASNSVQVDTRIISVTNKSLADEVAAGRFRQDLFYRLAVLHLEMPPLRDRKEDIPALAARFLAEAAAPHGLSPELEPAALDVLMRYDWPGNVRELRNVLRQVVANAPRPRIFASDLPALTSTLVRPAESAEATLASAAVQFAAAHGDEPGTAYPRAVETIERALIAHALTRFDGNQSLAADYLGLHRNTLRNKLRDLKIDPADPATRREEH